MSESKKELVNFVSAYLDTTTKLDKVNKRKRELDERKKIYKEKLIQYMKTHNIRNINIGNEKIKLIKKKIPRCLNKKVMSESLVKSKQLKDPNKADRLVEFIYKNKPHYYKYDLVIKKQ